MASAAAVSARVWKEGHLQQKRGGALGAGKWQPRYIQLLADSVRAYDDDSMHRPPRWQLQLDSIEIVEQSDVVFELVSRTDSGSAKTLSAEDARAAGSWLRELYWLRYRAVGGGVFGRSLADVMRAQADYGVADSVPRIVVDCVSILSTETALAADGLLQKSGHKKAVTVLRLAYQRGETPDMTAATPHEVATLLRVYLCELPEPVVPYVAYASFLTAGQKISLGDADVELVNLKKLVGILPAENRNLLKMLCCLFELVHRNSDRNLMDATAIATLFSSSLLSDDNDRLLVNAEMALDPQPRVLAVSTIVALVENYSRVFGDIPFEPVSRREPLPAPPMTPQEAATMATLGALNLNGGGRAVQQPPHQPTQLPAETRARRPELPDMQRAMTSITQLYHEKSQEACSLMRELVSVKCRLAQCTQCQKHLLNSAPEPASAPATPLPNNCRTCEFFRSESACMRRLIAELSDRMRSMQAENEALYKMLQAFNGTAGSNGNDSL